MVDHKELRSKTRVKIAGKLAGRVHATIGSNLLDLSATGARIEHFGLLRKGTTCSFELPSELGGLTLSARVVRSTVVGKGHGPDGEERFRYESGLVFANLTPEQEAALSKLLT
jgi:hypothetical protein